MKFRFYGTMKGTNNQIIYSNWYSCSESIEMALNRKIWLEAIAYNVNIEYLKTC